VHVDGHTPTERQPPLLGLSRVLRGAIFFSPGGKCTDCALAPALHKSPRRSLLPLYGRFMQGSANCFIVHSTPRWYAVQTRSRFEKSVAAQLSAKSVENYLPAFEEEHRWKDRRKIVEMPAFPGYVFARFADDGGARLRILKTSGAVRILGRGEEIEPVADHEIDSVRLLLKSRTRCSPHPFVREGAWVRVRRGPLKDLEGLLVRVKSYSRLIVSIELLSQAVATEVDTNDVEPARRPDVSSHTLASAWRQIAAS
jgi:transcription antitermination factor NusG